MKNSEILNPTALALLCLLGLSCSQTDKEMSPTAKAAPKLPEKIAAPALAKKIKKIKVKKVTAKTVKVAVVPKAKTTAPAPAKAKAEAKPKTQETGPTLEKADKLYEGRGEDIEKARQAATMYAELALAATDSVVKAKITVKRAQAFYYIANELEKEKKGKGKNAFEECYVVADNMVQLLKNPESMEEEEQKAAALFWYGACIGQAKKALGLSKLKKAMKEIIDLGYEGIYHYGVYRTFGRIKYLMPWALGGDKAQSKQFHKRAFENTLAGDDLKVSVHGLNNLFYADVLSHKDIDEVGTACEILQTFIEQDPKTLLKSRIPETVYEMEQAVEKINSLKCPPKENEK